MVQVIKSNPFLSAMTSNQAYRLNQQPRGFSSLGQQMAMNNQMGMANRKPTTPPNYRNNLLNYILSPSGQGMAQGLLEASGYSTRPVSFGEALSRGMGRSREAQRYADQIAFRDKKYEDTKAFRDQQTDFQNLMAEKAFGLSERKFLSNEELELKKIGLTEEQINNAKQNNINLLAFKNKKLSSDEKLALSSQGLTQQQIDNLENYRIKSLEFQDKKLTSDENIALQKLGVSEQQLELNKTSIDNAWKLGMENIGLKTQEINNIAQFRSNTLALDKDKLDFSKQKFDKDTELTLKKLGLTETQINNAQEYNSERIRLQEKGLDIQKIVADANMIRANSIDNRTTKQKELDEYASLFNLDKNSEEFKEIFNKVMTKPNTVFNMGDKVGLEKSKSALTLVEKDYNKYANASSNKTAITQMRSASDNFKTGAFADTRIFAGQIADLVGLDEGSKNEFINPSSGENFKAAQNKLVRQLADGLVNLNKAELKMLQDNYPKVSNTREGNNLMFNIFEKEYEAQEKILNAIENYYSSDQSLKEYGDTKRQILNDYSKEVKGMLDEYTGSLDNFNKLMMDNVGKTGGGISVSGKPVDIAIEKNDKFIGLNENGMPTYQKLNGTQYIIMDAE
tara:strand:- start:4068 stop:5936 length:1869 start_codon:yes stop_codon:yes gene_type:complete